MATATVLLAPAGSGFDFLVSKDPVAVSRRLASEDAYTRLGHFETPFTGKDAAEEMFDLSNNPGREDERAERWGLNRSLSVGDVVVVDAESFLCLSVGWKAL